jgi:hypothetical protein
VPSCIRLITPIPNAAIGITTSAETTLASQIGIPSTM